MNGLIPFTGLKRQYATLREEILDATDKVLSSGQLMNGAHTLEFERWLAQRNNSRFALTCHSGTSALEIIAAYHRDSKFFPNPPRVMIPTMTYAATASAFINAGWDVQLVDTDYYGIIDVDKIPDVSYQAVVAVGLYGADISDIGNPYRWHFKTQFPIIIEDAAQHWLAGGGYRVGVASAISFDPMKNLACYGNGGAVVTNDPHFYEWAVQYRDNAKPLHEFAGTNSRMSEVDCAQMMVKTRYIDAWQERREQIADYWIEQFKHTRVRCMIDDSNRVGHCIHKFVIQADNRDAIKWHLDNVGIETRIHYTKPLHEMPAYSDLAGPGFMSIASSLSRCVLSLPIYPELQDSEVEYIATQVASCA